MYTKDLKSSVKLLTSSKPLLCRFRIICSSEALERAPECNGGEKQTNKGTDANK